MTDLNIAETELRSIQLSMSLQNYELWRYLPHGHDETCDVSDEPFILHANKVVYCTYGDHWFFRDKVFPVNTCFDCRKKQMAQRHLAKKGKTII